jgi:Transposase and inactivated derivatives
MHTWYWLADTCRHEQIPFALGHAFGMKAVHQSKTKSDAHDAEIIARLLRGGNFPLAYAYPAERRGLRDLLRTRLRLVRQRAELYGHIHTVRRQLNLAPVGNDVKYTAKRDAIAADIPDPHAQRGVEARLNLLAPLDTEIHALEWYLEVAAKQHYPAEFAALKPSPASDPSFP